MAGVPQQGLWLEEGLVINLNHSFRGRVWGWSEVGGWGLGHSKEPWY